MSLWTFRSQAKMAVMTRLEQRLIGVVGFEDANTLDIAGPAEVFSGAFSLDGDSPRRPFYKVIIIGLTAKPFRTSAGIVIQPERTLKNAPHLDTLIVPGGSGLRVGPASSRVAEWVLRRAPETRRVVSVCTGIYGLAPTGLLDGRTVTTHWRFAADVARRFPRLNVDPHPLFLKDGKFYTSAGVTAGIDLALALIQDDCGQQTALEVARGLVLYLKRPGGQEQFSEPLQVQTKATERFADIVAWIASNLHGDLSVETLAEKAALCSRHFRRRFQNDFGCSPAAFVQEMRLDETRRQLVTSRNSVEMIAESVGFADPDSFRRAFRKRFGVSPSDYRAKFNASSP
jgi:transcriptional regulator GlxA family with amidase domain